MFKNYPCILQQNSYDCGPACLASISNYYKSYTTITKIRELSETTKDGTNIRGLLLASKLMGFDSKAVEIESDYLKDTLDDDFTLPAIAHVIINSSLSHYVVIYKLTKNKVLVADPSIGLKYYTKEEFLNIWTGVLVLLTPSSFFLKEKPNKLIPHFLKLVKPEKKLILNIFIFSILFSLLGIISPFYFQYLIDNIISFNLPSKLHAFSLGLIILFTIQVIFSFIRNYLLLNLGKNLDKKIILDFTRHLIKLPLSFYSSRTSGEIIARLTDASKVREAISATTVSILVDVTMLFASGIILFLQNSTLFLITLCSLPIYIVIVVAFNKTYEKLNKDEMENNAQMSSYIIESIKGAETIKSFNAEDKVDKKIEDKFTNYVNSYMKLGMLNNHQVSIKTLVELLGNVFILWVGAYYVLSDDMTVGQLITFYSLQAFFLVPLQNLIDLQPILQSAKVAAQRLLEIKEVKIEKKQTDLLTTISLEGDIQFENVSFGYNSNDTVLKNISMIIPHGKKVAFVGNSGSGKTTIIKLLQKFYETQSGSIKINGYNIKNIDSSILRKRISYVSQNTFFFSGTIMDNLCLGLDDKDINEKKLRNVLKLTKSDEFIYKLPLNINTYLEENGENLSGGQKQRLAMARALLKKPNIFILDEATSNLDTITEKSITSLLNNVPDKMTTIIIAHRLSTIKNCDLIYVLDNGNIIESGTHDYLIQRNGKYRELWYAQFNT